MNQYQTLAFKKEDGIGIITLNRPECLNSINSLLVAELGSVLDETENDEDTKAVIITGSGKSFCAGADLNEVFQLESALKVYEWINNAQDLFHKIDFFNKPVVASINGMAMGGGMELSIACDLRIIAADAFMAVPEINVGVLPVGGGMSRLPRLVGAGRAKDLVYTGRRVSADEALGMGLVNRVVEGKMLYNYTLALARELSQKPPVALKIAKSTINTSMETDIRSASEMERRALAILFSTEDTKEGIQSFIEKRKPQYRGK